MTYRSAWAALVLVASLGCGATSQPTSDETVPLPAEAEPVELSLRTPQGTFVDVGDTRGRPVLLFLFATFDGMSQAGVRPLSQFIENHPEVHVIGIAIQPNARTLLDAWAEAIEPQFPVTYDPEGKIHVGQSILGADLAVPTYVMLDKRGFEVARQEGYADVGKLEALLAATRRRR